jgi:uncharacterized protein (TIGR04255 family)
MAAPRHLRNPPITEALVDIRFVGDQPDEERLEPLKRQMADRYPQLEIRRALRADFTVGKAGALKGDTQDLGFHGLYFKSRDETSLVQFRRDGFTYNRLQPYTDAPTIFSEALDLWVRYAELVAPVAVSRLALRYINKLNLPLNHQDDLTRFLLAPPMLPEGLDASVTDFTTRIAAHGKRGIVAIVTQKLGNPPEAGGPVPLILDLDVFKINAIETDRAHLLDHLEELRSVKNLAFFGSITEDAVKLYE